jgi:hypothetical protein
VPSFLIAEEYFVVANKKSGSHGVKKQNAAEKKAGRTSSEPTASATIDRRAACDRRGATDRRTQSVPVAIDRRMVERRVKVSRRRQIDPTTCERDYTPRRSRVHERYGRLQAAQRADVSDVQRGTGGAQIAGLREAPDGGRNRAACAEFTRSDAREPRGTDTRKSLARISHRGEADIPVCQEKYGQTGRQECLPHRIK